MTIAKRKRTAVKTPGILLSLGAIGYVSKVNDYIAVKTLRRGDTHDEYRRRKFAFECKVYDIFEAQYPLCPDISRSFLRVPAGNFLALCTGGNLFTRLHQHQLRYPNEQLGRLVKVVVTEPSDLIDQWIMELSSAASWLESLGYAHTDIRPENLILDSDDHLKLTDFDAMEKIGTKALGCAPPWARCLGLEAGNRCGTFGDNGAQYESFAIGSVLYFMTRGHEPYDDGVFGPCVGGAQVALLQHMLYPSLVNNPVDNIIRKCWHGEYRLLKDLAEESTHLAGCSIRPRATCLDPEAYEQAQKECQELVISGFLDIEK